MKYLKKYFVIPSVLVLVTLVIVTVSTLPGFAADCSRGEQLYKQALSTTKPDK
ncbi:MAG: hypothetical protein GY757_39955 [bacterium]|nr:hypothetical protein [bacterium]